VLALTAAACASSAPDRRPAAGGRRGGGLDSAVVALLRAGGLDETRIRCNQAVRWEPRLDRYARETAAGIARILGVEPGPEARKAARHHALGYLVRSYFEQTGLHNLGVMRLRGASYRDESGGERPLLVFRSGLVLERAGEPSRCFRSLIEHGRVRHVINLYSGTFPFRDLIRAEQELAQRLGARYVDTARAPAANWRQEVQEEADFHRNQRAVSLRLAALIREQILRPGGALPRGNVYLHCGGGMHRSGIVFGILRRCINRDPLSEIDAEYRRHTGWRSAREPGGFEPLNLLLIREFDCSLLDGAASAPATGRAR
jgi:hypothetical protein